MKIIKYVFIIALGLMVVSCASTRRYPFESFSLEPMTKKGLVKEIKKTENSETYTQINRYSAEYHGVQEQNSFRGFVRIAQDSLLMLSVSPMVGGEAMRVLLSADSSKMINRVDDTYSVSSYSAAQQMIPLSYELLQSVLAYHFSEDVTNDYALSVQDKMYALEDKGDAANYTLILVDGNYMVRKLLYKDFKNNSVINVVYNTFFEGSNGKLFPQNLEITIKNKSEVAVLRLTVKRVEFTSKLSFPFRVSSKYVRI